jgi:squalene-hopene/tetraprenyl-beta-curcumene cyclase
VTTMLRTCSGMWLIGLLSNGLVYAEDAKPAPPPKITRNSPNEPLAGKLSLAKSAEILDSRAVAWTRTHQCGSCHTNYSYLLARPFLKQPGSPAEDEVRKFFEKRAANWDTAKPRWDAEVIATAATLAFHDAHTTGKLHDVTRSALDRMWTLQRADGAWNWIKCGWVPLEHDDYYGAVYTALGLGVAPDGYAQSEKAQAGVTKLRRYFQNTPPPDLHHRTMLLWASLRLDGLMTPAQREETIQQLLANQRPDGGWGLAALGKYQRRDKTPNDPNGPSDGYGTGLVLFVLHEAGVPSSDSHIQRGLAWLRSNQRESGRWFTRSLNDDDQHYIADAGTAFAVMALRVCGEKWSGEKTRAVTSERGASAP